MRRMFWFVFAAVGVVVVGPSLAQTVPALTPAGDGEPIVCETVPAEPGAEICAQFVGHVWDGTDWVPVAPTLPATS